MVQVMFVYFGVGAVIQSLPALVAGNDQGIFDPFSKICPIAHHGIVLGSRFHVFSRFRHIHKNLADFKGQTVGAQNGSLQYNLVKDQMPGTTQVLPRDLLPIF